MKTLDLSNTYYKTFFLGLSSPLCLSLFLFVSSGPVNFSCFDSKWQFTGLMHGTGHVNDPSIPRLYRNLHPAVFSRNSLFTKLIEDIWINCFKVCTLRSFPTWAWWWETKMTWRWGTRFFINKLMSGLLFTILTNTTLHLNQTFLTKTIPNKSLGINKILRLIDPTKPNTSPIYSIWSADVRKVFRIK